jgi:hypothetical protein
VVPDAFLQWARRILAGDDSAVTVGALEDVVLGMNDPRLHDLATTLSLYSPGSGPDHSGPDEVHAAIRAAMATLGVD